jgi:hypothetical protein
MCVFVALVTQHAMCILLPAMCLTLQYFAHYLIKSLIFDKKVIDIKYEFLFYLQLLSETFLILVRTERDMIKNAS